MLRRGGLFSAPAGRSDRANPPRSVALSDVRTLARPIPFAIAIAALVRARGVPVDPSAAHRSDALARVLVARGMTATAADVTWLDEGAKSRFFAHGARAIVRASKGEDPPRLLLVEARLSPEGVLLDVGAPRTLTQTDGVEETPPAVHGQWVATALVADGTAIGVKLVDLAGEPRPEGPHWTAVARVQNAITNWQETGQPSGIGRRSFQLSPPTSSVTLRFEGGALVVSGDGHEARIPQMLPAGTVDVEDKWLKPQPMVKGQVGNLVTWAVDRVRNSDWFGDENMQRLKAVAFGAVDVVTRAKSKVTTDTSAKEIGEEMGLGDEAGSVVATDAETGWPPPPITPLFTKAPIAGEGEWRLLDKDPFVGVNAGAPPAFATAFIRTDRERPYTRIYVTVWDPRQVTLHPMGGSTEPVSATGTAAPGLIPRTPKTMKRLVGAFNGGFQALHGEFGMMSDGVVYLPPKPYGATVAELRDGSTAFGVWPVSPDIPPDIVGYRQNLTPLVLDQKPNPYGRSWWGGTPPGWADRVHTTRSGLCLTAEGFVAYFYGNGIDAEVLGQAMIQARCKMGMHLDMNPGHTGLEFYRAAPSSEWPPLGRAYQGDWETEGELSGMKEWRFRARRMVRGMGLMNFPRYIQRESRDYFYLLLRPVLPGPDIATPITPPEANEGKWRVKQLPQHGFPNAIATTTLRPDKARPDFRIRLLKIDAHTVKAQAGGHGEASAKDQKLVALLQPSATPRTGEPALWWSPSGFAIGKDALPGGVAMLASGGAGDAAALGVDEDGMLIYAEIDGEARPGDGKALDRALAELGCVTRMTLDKPLSPLLGGTTTLASTPGKRAGGHEVRLVRVDAPGGRTIFPDTPVVPQSEWGPLQMKRIRYFKKNE